MSSLPSDYKTRGNSGKLEVRRCRYDLRKYLFSNRITNMWNSLLDRVVMADTVNQSKNRLDKHWANYALLYDYRVNYIWNRKPVCCIEKCENLDVDLEAIACVHSLQYSTVLCAQLTRDLFAIAKFLFTEIQRSNNFKIATVRHLGFSKFALLVTIFFCIPFSASSCKNLLKSYDCLLN